MAKNKSPIIGIIVGIGLIIFPDPATTILGVGVVAYSSYKAGWFGRP